MNNTCFVIMPFGSLQSSQRNQEFWSEVYEDILVPSVANAAPELQCVRADEIASQGNIISDLVSYLLNSKLVIADLTDRNPNVFYELGVRHAFGLPTVHITQNLDDIPFDLRAYRTIKYGISPRSIASFELQLGKILKAVLNANEPTSNPVIDFVGDSGIDSLIQSIGARIDQKEESIRTINLVEARLKKLETAQHSLKELVTAFGNERDTLLNQVEDLGRQRNVATQSPIQDVRIDPSGLWIGNSGRMRINLSGNQIEGDYDWKGYEWIAHIRGELNGLVIKFDWMWDRSDEHGNGFFLLNREGTTLSGGWFEDRYKVDLEEAVQGNHDRNINPWHFMRPANNDRENVS